MAPLWAPSSCPLPGRKALAFLPMCCVLSTAFKVLENILFLLEDILGSAGNFL